MFKETRVTEYLDIYASVCWKTLAVSEVQRRKDNNLQPVGALKNITRHVAPHEEETVQSSSSVC